MYLLRFKRHQEKYLFLTEAEHGAPWGLTDQLARARKFEDKTEIRAVVANIQSFPLLKNPYEWAPRDLFLIRLYGYNWDDQVEGLLIEMHEEIKAQILDDDLTVIETHRMHNQVWESH